MKKFSWVLATTFLFLSGNVTAQDAWDTLYLRNGQVVFGELKRISIGTVLFKMDDLAEVNLKMSKVKTIKATKRLYRIETINQKVFFSTLSPGEKDGFVVVGDSTGGGEIPLEYIKFLSYYSDKKNLFEGNVSMGYNYTKSSDIGRFNYDATLRYILKDFAIKNTMSSIITQENNQWTRDRESFMVSGTYLLNSDWKAVGLLNYQLNRELGLQYRFQEGAGISYDILSTSHIRFLTLTGLVVNQEKSFDAESSNTTYEVPIHLSFDFFRFSRPEVSLATDNSMYISLSQKGRIRQDGEIRLDWKVVSDFTLNLKFYYNYDNQPLSGANTNFDYGVVFGVGYKWD